MYNGVSQDYIDAVRSDARCWKPRLVFSNFTLYNVDTIGLTNGSQSNDNITVGSVVSPTIKLVLNNMANMPSLTGKDFTWELGILTDLDDFDGDNDPQDFEYAPVAQFRVNKVKRNGEKWEVECYHKLSQADAPCNPALEFPTTAEILLASCCNSLGLTLRTTGLSPVIPIASVPSGVTIRQVMGWCAALYGGFITADRSDGVVLHWYSNSGYTVPANAIAEPEIGEEGVTFTAVRCIVDDETYTTGEGRAMVFECPFMTPSRFDTVAQGLIGFSYRPCKLKYLLGDPLIDPWDLISLVHEGTTYTIPAASLTLDVRGGVSGTFEAKGGEVSEEHTDPITRAVSRLAQKILDEEIPEIEQDLAEAIQEATESIRGGASGFFHIVADENGINKETIWCDNIDPYQATHGIRINANGIGFWRKSDEPDKNIFNGTYTQAWTIDGNLIADFIRAGTLRGITIICQQGSIGGWTINESSIVSPDESVRLDSTYDIPLTTHANMRTDTLTHNELRTYTHNQIRYLRKQQTGKSQISASSGEDIIYLKEAQLICEHNGKRSFRASVDGIDLYDTVSGEIIGFIGQNNRTEDKKGLVFDLESAGSYMGWAVRETPTATNYNLVLWYDRDDNLIKIDKSTRIRGDLTVNNNAVIKKGLTVSNNVDANSISSYKMSISTDLEAYRNKTDISGRDGLDFFDSDGNHIGGLHAEKRVAKVQASATGDEVTGITIGVPTSTDFVGFWRANYGDRNYEGKPIFAWYKDGDHVYMGKDLWIGKNIYTSASTNSSNQVKGIGITTDGTNRLEFYDTIAQHNNELVGAIHTEYENRFASRGLQIRLLNGDFMRWTVGSSTYSVVMQYTVSSDQLDVHRDLNMHSHDIINANIQSSSDERLKENIKPCEVDCLEVIKALGLIEYDWKYKKNEHETIGFSAQQVGDISPDLQGNSGGYLTVNEGRLIRYLVGAVQQLAAEVEALKNGT